MESIEETILRKALGYEVTEKVEEFNVDADGNKTLVKLKKSTKHVPPDLSAARVVLDTIGKREHKSERALEAERAELLKRIKAELSADKKTIKEKEKIERKKEGNR